MILFRWRKVKKDKGGALLGQLIDLEAVLSPPQDEVIDPHTGLKRPVPPQIVLERDKWELDNLPFLPDRQHHCTQWYMWQTLGLPKILSRLFAGSEYKADDPDLVKLAKTAISSRDNIKSILGFWIPDNCSPTWLLGMLVQKLGLKTASRKKGSSGTQVKYYSLSVKEFVFAQQVLEYRQQQRHEREERFRQRQEENQLYRVMMETQYGLTPDSISTPDSNNDCSKLQQGVNMAQSQSPSVLDWFKPALALLESTVNLGIEVIKGLVPSKSDFNRLPKILIHYLSKPMRLTRQSN